jgi:hypothetical protein
VLVSRKKRSLIHFIAGKAAARVYIFPLSHQGIKILDVPFLGGEVLKPFAEGGILGPTLGVSDGPGLL